MTKKEQLLNLVQEKGYITSTELKMNHINYYYVSTLVKEKKIYRVSSGYYILTNGYVDNFYVVLSKCKKAVFSHATALYLHNLSDRVPLIYDVTVPYGYGNCYKNEKNIVLHYNKVEYIDLGVMEVESPFKMNLKVYDIERTICDIIKNKNKMDIDIFTKALQRYAKMNCKDLQKLMKYAKLLGVDKKVREYMELLL